MTNADKFLRDGVSVEELAKDITKFIADGYPDSFIFPKSIENYFKAETKPTLTEDERVILKHIDKQFYYIKRISGELQLTNKEHTWCDYELLVDNEVFQFIKEGEEYSIEELLKDDN